MTAEFSLFVSSLALGLSVLTAWLTLFRRGTVMMTKPTVVYFGPDGGFKGKAPLKVYFRCLLYATAKRGCVIESMYIRLKRNETAQNFNIWVYGERQLSRGSGLYIPDTGIASNHHFLLPTDGTHFQFLPGKYLLEVMVQVAGKTKHNSLYSLDLEVTASEAESIQKHGQGLYFDWGPDAGKYHSNIKSGPHSDISRLVSELTEK